MERAVDSEEGYRDWKRVLVGKNFTSSLADVYNLVWRLYVLEVNIDTH